MLWVLPVAGFMAVVAFALHAFRVAELRDRSPLVWSGLTVAAAAGAAWASWRWLARGLDASGDTVLPTFTLVVGPLAAAALVVAALRRLAPGRPRVAGAVAVRQLGAGHSWRLEIDDGGVRLLGADGSDRRIAGVDLDRIQADGECLRLRVRSTGEELRLQITEFEDRERRCRTCDAMAAALGRHLASARVVTRLSAGPGVDRAD